MPLLQDRQIWVLGSTHENADRCLLWREPFPNFSNCDILIINLSTLDKDTRNSIYESLNEGRRYIFDLLMTSEKEAIVILPTDQDQDLIDWLPLCPSIRKIKNANIGKYQVDSYLEDYMKTVEYCNYYIHSVNDSYFKGMTDPRSNWHENLPFTNRIEYSECQVPDGKIIQNQAKQNIGGYIRYVFFEQTDRRTLSPLYTTGDLIFLPPSTKYRIEQAINLIVNNLVGKELKESPPSWVKNIEVPTLRDIERTIIEKEQTKSKLETEIKELIDQKDEKTRFRRLLWTKDAPLEDIVKDAFVCLGFPEIKKLRATNLEDWVIEFKTLSEYQFGVFEVKGADKRTALADLTQCNKWVEDYMLDNKKANGIFVPNQFRLEDIKQSANSRQREHFEPNELKYAGSRDICILPSHEIFKAVIEKMNNSSAIIRKNLEEKIASAKGLCKLV